MNSAATDRNWSWLGEGMHPGCWLTAAFNKCELCYREPVTLQSVRAGANRSTEVRELRPSRRRDGDAAAFMGKATADGFTETPKLRLPHLDRPRATNPLMTARMAPNAPGKIERRQPPSSSPEMESPRLCCGTSRPGPLACSRARRCAACKRESHEERGGRAVLRRLDITPCLDEPPGPL